MLFLFARWKRKSNFILVLDVSREFLPCEWLSPKVGLGVSWFRAPLLFISRTWCLYTLKYGSELWDNFLFFFGSMVNEKGSYVLNQWKEQWLAQPAAECRDCGNEIRRRNSRFIAKVAIYHSVILWDVKDPSCIAEHLLLGDNGKGVGQTLHVTLRQFWSLV